MRNPSRVAAALTGAIVAAGLIVVVIAAGWFFVSRRSATVPTAGLQQLVASSADVGALRETAAVSARDGGGSAEVGGKILWAFGDTFYTPTRPFTAATQNADRYRSATGATSPLTDPLQLTTPIDAVGAPSQLIPYTADELAYNRATNDPGDRYAVWPVAPVSLGKDAWVYYLRVHIQAPSRGAWTSTVGVARLRAGMATAERVKDPLFGDRVPSFRSPLAQGTFVYLYDDCVQGCRVARAPIYTADNPSTYQAWNGYAWTPHLSQAAVVIPAGRNGVTVMWSGYVQKYIGAYIPFGSQTMEFVTADNPQGPWSNPVGAFTGKNAQNGDYAPYFHAELTASTSPDLFITYSRSLGGFRGDVRLERVTLSAANSSHSEGAVRIMPMGDSVTDGTVFNAGGYRIELDQRLRDSGCACNLVGTQSNGEPALRDKDSEAHSGATIAALTAGAPEWIAREKPDIILLMAGANDLGDPATAPGAAGRLGQLVDTLIALRPSATVVVASVPHGQSGFGTRAHAYNVAVAQLIVTRKNAGQRIVFADVEHAVASINQGDGVHPSAAGYTQMGATFAAVVQPLVAHGAHHSD